MLVTVCFGMRTEKYVRSIMLSEEKENQFIFNIS